MTATRQRITAKVLDGVAKVCAGILETGSYAFAAGVTEPGSTVVRAQLEDFEEAGLPAIVVGFGPWTAITGGGQTRLRYEVPITVWRPRLPLDEVFPLLCDDVDTLRAEFEAHSKAYFLAQGVAPEFSLQSALLTGGDGIEARALGGSRHLIAETAVDLRWFLVAPVTAEVVVQVQTNPQPS